MRIAGPRARKTAPVGPVHCFRGLAPRCSSETGHRTVAYGRPRRPRVEYENDSSNPGRLFSMRIEQSITFSKRSLLCVQPLEDYRVALRRSLPEHDLVMVPNAFEAIRAFNV